MAGLSFAGCVYIKQSGTDQCWVDIGNATKFEIVENSTEVQRTSKRCDSFGSALDTIATKSPSTFTVDFDELDIENLAFATLGEKRDHTQVAAAVSDSLIAVPKVDCLYFVGDEMISAVTVNAVTNASGSDVTTSAGTGDFDSVTGLTIDNLVAVAEVITLTFTSATAYDAVGSVSGALGSGDTSADFATTAGVTILAAGFSGVFAAADTVVITIVAAAVGAALVLDTDYSVVTQAGLINIISTGAVSAGDTIAVSYTAADLTVDWKCAVGSVNEKIDVAVKMIGRNRATNQLGILNIPKVSLIPAAGIDFLGDDFVVASMSGSVLVCPNNPDAYTFCADEGAGAQCEITP